MKVLSVMVFYLTFALAEAPGNALQGASPGQTARWEGESLGSLSAGAGRLLQAIAAAEDVEPASMAEYRLLRGSELALGTAEPLVNTDAQAQNPAFLRAQLLTDWNWDIALKEEWANAVFVTLRPDNLDNMAEVPWDQWRYVIPVLDVDSGDASVWTAFLEELPLPDGSVPFVTVGWEHWNNFSLEPGDYEQAAEEFVDAASAARAVFPGLPVYLLASRGPTQGAWMQAMVDAGFEADGVVVYWMYDWSHLLGSDAETQIELCRGFFPGCRLFYVTFGGIPGTGSVELIRNRERHGRAAVQRLQTLSPVTGLLYINMADSSHRSVIQTVDPIEVIRNPRRYLR